MFEFSMIRANWRLSVATVLRKMSKKEREKQWHLFIVHSFFLSFLAYLLLFSLPFLFLFSFSVLRLLSKYLLFLCFLLLWFLYSFISFLGVFASSFFICRWIADFLLLQHHCWWGKKTILVFLLRWSVFSLNRLLRQTSLLSVSLSSFPSSLFQLPLFVPCFMHCCLFFLFLFFPRRSL